MNKIVYILPALFICWNAGAQEATKKWTLEECINHAISHNIDLKQQEQQKALSEVDLNTSKNSWLPDLNASIGQNFDFGRSPSKDGTIVDRNSSNSSAYLALSMPVFDGFKIKNDIAARKLDLMAATETLKKAKEDLTVGVASYFLQVLYTKEIKKVTELQLDLTNRQVARTEELVNAGRVPLANLYDIKAQLAKDEASLVEATNNAELALLDLAQALELERETATFDIEAPTIEDAIEKYISSIVPPTNVYENALAVKPQIKAQEYQLESSKKTLKIAQSGYFPKLNLNLSYSNGYYHYNGSDAVNVGFSDQIKQNERKIIGFSLSIPIFNRFQVRNNVRSARINILNRELALENSKKVLYKEIQQAYYNATASQEQYIASTKAVEAGKEAFAYAEEKYKTGKSSVYEFNEAKTKYAQSLAEQAQAKYNFIFRAKILDFYNGNPIIL